MENTTTNNTQGSKYNPQEFVDLADKTYLDYVKDGRYKDIISAMANLGDYSLRNQMLILQQSPNATKVNSMNGWNFQKRNILKGSQAIKILAPVFDTILKTENGEVAEKKSDYVSGYKINFVFDIAQTESKEQGAVQAETEDFKPYYEAISNALANSLKSYEFKTADINSDGILDTRRKTITIKQGLSEEQTIKTLVDQVAAALVLGRDRSKFQGLRSETLANISAIEISAVSAIVSKRLGLVNQKIQEPNFSEMSDGIIDKFANNIGVIRSISQLMIKAAENAITEVQTQKKIAQESAKNQINEPALLETEPKTKSKTVTKTTTKTKIKAQAEMA